MDTLPDAPRLPPQDWLGALAEAREDVAAGRVHDLADVLAELDQDIAEMEAEAVARAGKGRNRS